MLPVVVLSLKFMVPTPEYLTNGIAPAADSVLGLDLLHGLRAVSYHYSVCASYTCFDLILRIFTVMTQEDRDCEHDGADETVLNGQAVSALCSGSQDSPGTRITTELLNRGNDRLEQGNMVPPSKVYRMSPPRSDAIMENLFFTHKPAKAPAVMKKLPRSTPRPQEIAIPLSITRTLRFGKDDLPPGPSHRRYVYSMVTDTG